MEKHEVTTNQESPVAVKPRPPKRKPKKDEDTRHLPKFKVLLLNDDVNDFGQVVLTVHKLTPLSHEEAVVKVTEAHKTGVALLLVTHKERAELYQEQFHTHVPPIKVRIEPDA